MEGSGQQRLLHKMYKNDMTNNEEVVMSDSLQAQLHLSLERLSDAELDQDDLKRLTSKKKLKKSSALSSHNNNNNSNDELVPVDSLDFSTNNNSSEPKRALPRLLQRASEGSALMDSLDDDGASTVVDDDEEQEEETFKADDDPYAELRYHPLTVQKSEEEFSTDDDDYRYYNDAGSTVTSTVAATEVYDDGEEENNKALNQHYEAEYNKFIQEQQPQIAVPIPSSGPIDQSPKSSHETMEAEQHLLDNKRKEYEGVDEKEDSARQQFEQRARALRRLRQQEKANVNSAMKRQQEKITVTNTVKKQQEKVAASNTTTKKQQISNRTSPRKGTKPQQDIIERNRAKAGQKASSASYLEIHAKKRASNGKANPLKKDASLSSSSIERLGRQQQQQEPTDMRVAKSATNLNENEKMELCEDDGEQEWLRKAAQLKNMRRVGLPKRKIDMPPRQFLRISTELSISNDEPTSPRLKSKFQATRKSNDDDVNPYPLLPPAHHHPNSLTALPQNGNMNLDTYINGGYQYPPPSINNKPLLPPIQPHSPRKEAASVDEAEGAAKLPAYKKYTIADYRNIKQQSGVPLGGLGADSEAARRRAEKATRAKKYAEVVRTRNNQHHRPTAVLHPRQQADRDAAEEKRKRRQSRQRALSYAREVPKPKVPPPPPSRIPLPDNAARGGTFTVDAKEDAEREGCQLKRRSSSTFTITTSKPSDEGDQRGGTVVDMDLIRQLRERHEREKAMVAQLTGTK